MQKQSSKSRPGDSGYISLDGITKRFDNGSIVAVEDFNLEIASDEFVVLVGPSGCGKTTTLRCIAGLEAPNSGRIFVDGTDVTDKKPKDRNLAFVFQSIALFPHMTVRENIQFGLDMITDLSDENKEQRTADAAKLLGIDELLNRKPSALSGGQQQRVSLGRAMVMEPSAFLLDEPFSALDANLRDQLRVEVKQLQRELETAMILVTHDQEEAMTLGDRIVIMDDAQIKQVGSPHEIYNQPANLFVADFIGSPSTNIIYGRIVETGSELKFTSELFDIALSKAQQDRYRGSTNQEVSLGIRPEYLNFGGNAASISATVNVVEKKGSQDAVYLNIKDESITAVVDQGEVQASNGDNVALSVESDSIWLFDQSGSRLL